MDNNKQGNNLDNDNRIDNSSSTNVDIPVDNVIDLLNWVACKYGPYHAYITNRLKLEEISK